MPVGRGVGGVRTYKSDRDEMRVKFCSLVPLRVLKSKMNAILSYPEARKDMAILEVKINSSHTHNTLLWYLLGVLIKIFDDHPRLISLLVTVKMYLHNKLIHPSL